MVDAFDNNLFWVFSIETYQAPHVEDGLLLLQDRHGLDVNIILLCCWLGGCGIRVKDKSVQQLIDETLSWRKNVIEPLRQMRRMIKRELPAVSKLDTERFRKHVKRVELEAEKFQQDVLYHILTTLPGLNAKDADRAGLMRSNLLTLFAVSQCDVDRVVIRPLLERLITSACDVMQISESEG